MMKMRRPVQLEKIKVIIAKKRIIIIEIFE